jgi:hypothetical protein
MQEIANRETELRTERERVAKELAELKALRDEWKPPVASPTGKKAKPKPKRATEYRGCTIINKSNPDSVRVEAWTIANKYAFFRWKVDGIDAESRTEYPDRKTGDCGGTWSLRVGRGPHTLTCHITADDIVFPTKNIVTVF